MGCKNSFKKQSNENQEEANRRMVQWCQNLFKEKYQQQQGELDLRWMNMKDKHLEILIKQDFELKSLNLYDNQVTSAGVQTICSKFTMLEYLDLSQNNISSCPSTIFQLPHLRKLWIPYNKLVQLPSSIGQLMNLKLLNIYDNKLSVLPEQIGQLKNLEELLQTNQIRKQIGEQIISLKQKVNNLQRQSSNQIKYDSFKRQLTSQINLRKRCQQKIYEEIDDVRKRVEELFGKGVEKIEFFHFKSEVTEELNQKIQTEYVQQAFNKWEIKLIQKIADDKIYLLIQIIQKALTDNTTANSADIMQHQPFLDWLIIWKPLKVFPQLL